MSLSMKRSPATGMPWNVNVYCNTATQHAEVELEELESSLFGKFNIHPIVVLIPTDGKRDYKRV